jgi:hypothetical protein
LVGDDALPEPVMPLWLFCVVLPDELPVAPVLESRFMVLLELMSPEALPVADPDPEPPVEAFGCDGAAALELELEPGAAAEPEVDGVVDELLDAPGPPEERSTRSSPQPTSATATAEAASSSRNFGFIKGTPCSWHERRAQPCRILPKPAEQASPMPHVLSPTYGAAPPGIMGKADSGAERIAGIACSLRRFRGTVAWLFRDATTRAVCAKATFSSFARPRI